MGEALRPSSVRVLGIEIKIRYVDEVGEDCMGSFCPEQLEILIQDNLPAENQRLVLWHEICHVIEVLGEIKISEAGICLYSTAWIQIMRDNRELATWSFGG